MAFWGIPKVRSVEGQEFFQVTQKSLSSTIYTSFKLVLRAFGFMHNLVMLLQDINKDES